MDRRQFLKASAMTLGGLPFAQGLLSFAQTSQSQPASRPLDALGELGFLDVTKAPYLADPTGERDSTKAIQQAVNDACENQMVCFFPSGTYLISDQISCEQKVYKHPGADKGDEYRSDRWRPCILIGSTLGPRPMIRLAPGAKGFDNPAKPKPAIWVWAQTRFAPKGKAEPKWGEEQPNISFNNIVRGIDIDIRGNAGACGIRHTGSQGSSLEDMTIQAEGAFAGMDNCPGQGGGTYDVTVIGGKYGIQIDKECRFPTLTGCKFQNQTGAAIRHIGGSIPVLFVGCSIEKTEGPAIDVSQASPQGSLSVIDSMIALQGGPLFAAKESCPSLVLTDVMVKGASHIMGNGKALPDPAGWTEIRRFAKCSSSATNIVNGTISADEIADCSAAPQSPSVESLRERHLWGSMPSFEDADLANVKSYGAVGDGVADDTAALKRAIAAHEKVFLPKGIYKVSDSIVLGPRTQLFGAARVVTEIRAAEGFGEKGIPLIATADDAEAITSLANVSLSHYSSDPNVTAVDWKAGHRSILRSVWVYLCDSKKKARPVRTHYTYKISGNGGGRWYAVNAYEGQLAPTSSHPEYRRLLVDGTTQPLALYAFNVERVRATPQSEIRNAQHVRVYYYKSEAGTSGGDRHTPISIVNSSDVQVHCVSGSIDLEDGQAVVDIIDSQDILVTQVRSFRSGNFLSAKVTSGSESVTVPANTRVVLCSHNDTKQ